MYDIKVQNDKMGTNKIFANTRNYKYKSLIVT